LRRKNGLCSIRVLDQAKAYTPGHSLPTMTCGPCWVFSARTRTHQKASVTTTSDFEPRILSGDEFSRFHPLSLGVERTARQLLKWLSDISKEQRALRTGHEHNSATSLEKSATGPGWTGSRISSSSAGRQPFARPRRRGTSPARCSPSAAAGRHPG